MLDIMSPDAFLSSIARAWLWYTLTHNFLFFIILYSFPSCKLNYYDFGVDGGETESFALFDY